MTDHTAPTTSFAIDVRTVLTVLLGFALSIVFGLNEESITDRLAA